MILDKRKLWLMCNLSVRCVGKEKQSEFADKFINNLNDEEVTFCLSKLLSMGFEP